MNRKLLLGVGLSALAPLLGGCLAGDDGSTSTEDDLSASSRSYVTLTRDTRKCAAPMCGGYWVKDVNRKTGPTYVSDLDFSSSGLEDADVEKVREAPAEELVLRGKLGPKESAHGTRPFIVSEAYRGLPGVTPVAGEIFYQAQDRKPAISCFTAPCPNEVATKLNSTAKTYFSGYAVKRAAAAFVNQEWLIERIEHHGAVVAASIVDGQVFAGGPEQVLDASQVYLPIADSRGPCPVFKLAACAEGQVWTYTRSVDGCVLPDKCVADGQCTEAEPPQCADGYQLSSWRVDGAQCTDYACDPTFLMP
jgi:hypothetical protein